MIAEVAFELQKFEMTLIKPIAPRKDKNGRVSPPKESIKCYQSVTLSMPGPGELSRFE